MSRTELREALEGVRMSYGAVGSRDVDVAAWNAKIDRAIAALAQPTAEPPAPACWTRNGYARWDKPAPEQMHLYEPLYAAAPVLLPAPADVRELFEAHQRSTGRTPVRHPRWSDGYEDNIMTAHWNGWKWCAAALGATAALPAPAALPSNWEQTKAKFRTWCYAKDMNPDDRELLDAFSAGMDEGYAEATPRIPRGAALGATCPASPAAARDVLAERERQKTVEGWTPAHDDELGDYQLSNAAACYLTESTDVWPWAPEWWKPKDRRSNLVRAGALILAEIERLDRACPASPEEPK